MNFYRGIRDDYDQVKTELKEIQHLYDENRREFESLKELNLSTRVEDKNEKLYYDLRSMFNGKTRSKYHPATLYYFINKTAYSGMIRYNSKGEYNVPYGRYKNFNTDLITKEHCNLLNGTEIMTGDYTNVFDLGSEDDFVFLDPPYDSTFSDYGNEESKNGFTVEMHSKLATDFYSLKAKAMMVIGKTQLTSELYGKNVI